MASCSGVKPEGKNCERDALNQTEVIRHRDATDHAREHHLSCTAASERIVNIAGGRHTFALELDRMRIAVLGGLLYAKLVQEDRFVSCCADVNVKLIGFVFESDVDLVLSADTA